MNHADHGGENRGSESIVAAFYENSYAEERTIYLHRTISPTILDLRRPDTFDRRYVKTRHGELCKKCTTPFGIATYRVCFKAIHIESSYKFDQSVLKWRKGLLWLKDLKIVNEKQWLENLSDAKNQLLRYVFDAVEMESRSTGICVKCLFQDSDWADSYKKLFRALEYYSWLSKEQTDSMILESSFEKLVQQQNSDRK